MIAPFPHQQHADCETGATVNLLKHAGITISEPMVFGLGSGLYFVHIPFITLNGSPSTGYRNWFITIFKKAVTRLGGTWHSHSFRSEQKSVLALDRLLEKNIPTALITNVFYLDYLPEMFRFQFSGHTLVAFGKENNDYLISDPVIDHITKIPAEKLLQARFAHAFPKPQGKLYYIDSIRPGEIDPHHVKKAIKEVCYNMTVPPLPWVGCNAIELLAKNIAKFPRRYTPEIARKHLSHIIQMQEVIGTGGGGFRYMYAAFLQEAGSLMNNPSLIELSEQMTNIGDRWRSFASFAARIVKEREKSPSRFDQLSHLLKEIAILERQFYFDLKRTS